MKPMFKEKSEKLRVKLKEKSDKLSVKLNEKWFSQLTEVKIVKEVQSPDLVIALKAEAENILESETRLYHDLKENKRDKDFRWIKQILHSGTLSDKISGHTLLIQDCPVYNINSIESLIGMVNTKGKRECLMALDALRDLFIRDLLIENKKLKPFNEQPLKDLDSISNNSPVVRKRNLILWLFEDTLKTLYRKFLHNLMAVSHDTVEKTKQKAVNVMYNLLKDNPEQEQFLLENLVNKIGDPSCKVGSCACYTLLQLLVHHPVMKGVVIQEVERLLFRPNLSERAKYYCLCFLNQVIFDHEDHELANNLIMIYFSQFKMFVKSGEVNTKMMSALLTGVTRAYPYAKLKEDIIMDKLDSMYRLVHIVNFNISIQALMLIFQVLDSKDSVSDRFYGALYRKLFDPALTKSSRQASLLNLIFKALKKDVAVVRVKAFVKRLLQVSLYQAPNLQCGILMLISELSKIHTNLFQRKYFLHFDSDSDSDEHYEDMPDEDDVDGDEAEVKNSPSKESKISSWVHREQKKNKLKYDFTSRNPLYCGAEYESPWELLFLRQSFHPSVALFTNQILTSTHIKYSGDPLLDFTTSRFLDRFVYRNPKTQSENFQNNVLTKVFGARKLRKAMLKEHPVNSQDYLQQKAQKIPPQEKFIYQYLKQRTLRKKKDDDSDIESVCSEEFEELLEQVHPEGKDELNFAKELGLQVKKKKTKRKVENNSEDEDSVDSDAEDFEFEEDEFKNEFEEQIDNVDTQICEEDFMDSDAIVNKRPNRKKRKVESLLDGNTFASAEEFSTLLEENAESKIDTISSEAFVNKDKADAKQIAWEMKRHNYVKGQKWQHKRRGKFRKNIRRKK